MHLLERDDVLSRLEDLVSEVGDGNGRLALIRGEAGIGKTSVVRELTDGLGARAHVLWGGCDDLLSPRPLGPVWDMALDEPALEEPLRSDNRQEVFNKVLELMSRSLRPTVIVIEDVHWADEATLDLIRFVGRRIDRTHGLVVLTYRDGEVAGDHPLRVAIGDLPYGTVMRFPLEPLSVEAIGVLAGADRDAAGILEITGGNPFFVSELAHSDTQTVPASIRDAVTARVMRLGDRARSLVELVSVVPGRAELTLVQEVLGEIDDAVDEAVTSGILGIVGDNLSFRHELARRSVEASLPELQRRELNLEIVEALHSIDGNLSRQAHHAREAHDADWMMRVVPSAARRAAGLESHQEAVRLLRALEPHLDRFDDEQLADHYDLWAFEEYVSDEIGDRVISRALELRRRLGEPVALGKTLLLASRIAWVDARGADAMARAEEAVNVLEPIGGEGLALAYSTLSQLAMLRSDLEGTLEYGRKALDLVDDRNSQVRAHALNNIGSITMLADYPSGVAELEESYRIAHEMGYPHDEGRAAVNLAWNYLYLRDVENAEVWVERAVNIVGGAEMPTFESYTWIEKAMLLEMTGDWRRSEELCREVLDSEAVLVTARVAGTILLAKLLVRRGAPDALDTARNAVRLAASAAEPQRTVPAAAVMAEARWLGLDIHDEEIAAALELLDVSYTGDVKVYVSDLAYWLRRIGALDSLPEQTLEPYVLEDAGEWRAAGEWWESRGIPYERAVALASGGDDEAMITALSIFDQLGALAAASRLRDEMDARGIQGIPRGPRRATRENPFGLTARQGEVLELLAADLTNAEIADRLFLSTRTVDHHVSAILSRLGASTRAEAVSVAAGRGLISSDA